MSCFSRGRRTAATDRSGTWTFDSEMHRMERDCSRPGSPSYHGILKNRAKHHSMLLEPQIHPQPKLGLPD
jgi:hypothetical protein